MERKVIQLVNTNNNVVALCNDGSIFKLTRAISSPEGYVYAWADLPNVPQPEPAPVEFMPAIDTDGPVYINVGGRSNAWVAGYVDGICSKDKTNPYDVFNEGQSFDDWQTGYEEGRIDYEKRKGR